MWEGCIFPIPPFHGKGAVNGVGGEVKRRAWLAVLSGEKIQCVNAFVEFFRRKDFKINVHLIEKESVDSMKPELDNRRENAIQVPGTPAAALY